MRANRSGLAAALGLLALALAGCPKKVTVPPAPEPHRPKPRAVARPEAPSAQRTDCDRWDTRNLPPALQYVDRSVEEGQNLANQGFDILRLSEDRGKPVGDRQKHITKAVDFFITALAADPYNVHATYNLAAAYARIKRKQCVINLLSRLLLLRDHPSQKAQVEAKIDRLLGRGKWKDNLDPDFYEMRDDPDFRELAKHF